MNNVIKFDVDNVNELAEVIGNEANEGYQVFVGFNDGESLYAVTDIDDGESEALYIESESPSENRSETMGEDFSKPGKLRRFSGTVMRNRWRHEN